MLDYEKYFYKNNFDEFHFIKDDDFFIEIYEDETSIYRIFLIIYEGKKIENADEIFKILNISKEKFEKEISQTKCLKNNMFIFKNKIFVRNVYKRKLLNFVEKYLEKNSDYINHKIGIKFATQFLTYYKINLYKKNYEMNIEKYLKIIDIDYKEYIKETFKNNNFDEPTILPILYGDVFIKKNDAFNFITLANEDLLDKIKISEIINEMGG